MTVQEFSSGFDTLLNSYSETGLIVLDEYEKSVFLTYALDLYVKELYSGEVGTISFESNEKARRQLDSLVTTFSKRVSSATNSNDALNTYSLGTKAGKYNHFIINLPSDCMYIVYEEIVKSSSLDSCNGTQIIEVLPVTHDDYTRVVRNPFRGPSSNRVLRLDKGDNQVELVSTYNDILYKMRYIKQPSPIILTKLPSEASINGYTNVSECELPLLLHLEILLIAVRMAIASRNLLKSE